MAVPTRSIWRRAARMSSNRLKTAAYKSWVVRIETERGESVERMKKDLQDFEDFQEKKSTLVDIAMSGLSFSGALRHFNSTLLLCVSSCRWSFQTHRCSFFSCVLIVCHFFSVLCFNDIADELEHHSRPFCFRMSGRVCLTRCYQCFFISFSHSFSDEMKWLSREKSPLDTINNFQFSQFPSHSHKLCHRCCSRSLAVSPKKFIFIGVSRELGTAKMASILSLFGWA